MCRVGGFREAIFLEGAMGNWQGKPFLGVLRTVLRWVLKAKRAHEEGKPVEEVGSVAF